MTPIKPDAPVPATVTVTHRGADRWRRGHPWIFRSDVAGEPAPHPGVVWVADPDGRPIGQALYSPASEIRLRLIERTDRPLDQAWWVEQFKAAATRRGAIDATAWRLVHGEGDGLPSLVVDRYDRWLVVQLLSAGLETMREEILDALTLVHAPAGILLRNDAAVRRHEGLAEAVELARGEVPRQVEVREGAVRYLAAPWDGQKTGAFLDQRPNRLRAGALTRPGGRALDCFAYHGSFALHLAGKAGSVLALDTSAEALTRGQEHAALNQLSNISWQEVDAFDALRDMDRAREAFDMVVVDPPAFAKSRSALGGAMRGYHEINLRAMRLLAPGGVLLSASCSFHLRRPEFLAMIAGAAADSGRRLRVVEHLGQGEDHPELVTVPETGYLKGVVLERW
ncbi:MAG: class I SAM-dependent rRNA methyltransferase [Gemmatimonadota bacterium]|nr:class I SAM-dependent rRNA methyltransferase [Gemmatimonadota bacterium]